MLPQIVVLHISVTEFWDITPRELSSILKGFKEKQKLIDERLYTQGLYNKIAFEVCLSHLASGFAGKKSNAKYIDKPFMAMASEKKSVNKADRDRAVWDMWAQSCKNSGLPPSPYN